MDFYELLEITRKATTVEVHETYRRLAIKYHPDKNIGKEAEVIERFKRIAEAFETLSDPNKRARYNLKHPVIQHKVKKPVKRKIVEEEILSEDPNMGNWRTGSAPLHDIWGRRLSPKERAEWAKVAAQEGVGPPPAEKSKKDEFIDVYANHYTNSTNPHIR